MYVIINKKAVKLEAVTFSELGMQENDIEEILRCGIDTTLLYIKIAARHCHKFVRNI